MKDKVSDKNLKRLRKYMAEEAKRLSANGGCVHKVDLDSIEEQKVCAFPGKKVDPMERDLDLLFQSNKNKS